MKLAALALLFILSAAQGAHAAQACSVETNDVGTITVAWGNFEERTTALAEECVDRRSKLYRLQKGSDILNNEEAYREVIDSCINLKCGAKK